MKLVKVYWYNTRGTENVPYRSTENNWVHINPDYIIKAYPHGEKPEEYIHIKLTNGTTYLIKKDSYEKLGLCK